MNATFETVMSPDGSTIAYQALGTGPTVILVGGAYNDRSTVAGLAEVLSSDFTAIAYDRRGRGDSTDSGDGETELVEKEVADLAALIDAVGGSAGLFGHSSGAVLAFEATQRGLPVPKLALYEAPYALPGSRPLPPHDVPERMRDLVRADKRDEAATLFFTESVGVPAAAVDGMRADPSWGWFAGLAHSLPYDVALTGRDLRLPTERLATIGVPTLAIAGANGFDWMRATMRAIADAVPGAEFVSLAGQDHSVLQQPEALREVLTDFFK
ncbi:MAG TPA: alpha/beta hydrolase [Pseudonocardiaceae bacterium]|nr:alpha/beta hydrolase [Pseudonocardiaceae bacterium]